MPLTVNQLSAIRRSLSRYVGDVSGAVLDDVLKGIKTSVESLIKPGTELRDGVEVEVGLNPATARAGINALLKQHSLAGIMESNQIDFALTTARDVAAGAGTYAKEALDADVVEAYPARELLRVYDRDVPRGFRRVGKTLISVPGDDWPTRWTAAANAVGDTASLAVLQRTGRMIALVASPLWQALGNGVGGYTDTLRNPYPPFAFNSGYDVNNIGRVECQELGLLQPGQIAPVPKLDPANLFAPIEEAA